MLIEAKLTFAETADKKCSSGWHTHEHFLFDPMIGVLRAENYNWVRTNWVSVQAAVDSAIAQGFVLTGARSEGTPYRLTEEPTGITYRCKHEPMRYVSFNMVYNICKICDKNLD